MDYKVVQPPKEIFENQPSFLSEVEKEIKYNLVATQLEISEKRGILIYFEGKKLPRRGFPFPEAIAMCNIVKRLFFFILNTFNPFLLLFVGKQKIINNFNEVALKCIQPYFIKEKYLSPISKEIIFLVSDFCKNIGLDGQTLGKILAHLIEYDDAYRYRLEDILDTTHKDLILKNPQKELKKIARVIKERDIELVSKKFVKVIWLIRILILIPKYRRAFMKTVSNCQFERLQLDEIDYYWILNRSDYKFLGLTIEQRHELL